VIRLPSPVLAGLPAGVVDAWCVPLQPESPALSRWRLTLSPDERTHIAAQLREIIRRSLSFYRATASMPDLYGRTSTSAAERARLNKPWMLPQRLWSFVVERNLLRAHNLLLTPAPERRIVLVDYDLVRRGRLYRMIYFAVRWMLFWRDHLLILSLRRG